MAAMLQLPRTVPPHVLAHKVDVLTVISREVQSQML